MSNFRFSYANVSGAGPSASVSITIDETGAGAAAVGEAASGMTAAVPRRLLLLSNYNDAAVTAAEV